VKLRHISMVAIRSPFCRSRPSYCALLSGEDLSRYSNKIESVDLRKFRISTILQRKWCPSKKHFAELDLQRGGKTADIDMIWRNYVTVTLCISEVE